MDKRRLHPRGRITRNTVTPEDVDERARELSLISGHEPNRRTASDRRQAKRELRGDPGSEEPADEPNIPGSGMGAPPTSQGRKIEPQLPHDDEVEAETVAEGMEEAEHSEMLEASKHPTRNEE